MQLKYHQHSASVSGVEIFSHGRSNRFVIFLASLAYAFPVLSLIDDGDAASSSISLYNIPPLISLVILSIYAFFNVSARIRSFFILSFISGAVVTYFTYYSMPFYDSSKFNSYFIVFSLFGSLLLLTLCLKEVQRDLDLILLATGMIGLFLLLLNPTEFDAGRITYGNSNPIWMGRILGVGALAAAAAAINRPSLRIPAVGLFTIIALSVLVTGSRGPFFSIFIALASTFGLMKFSSKYWIISIFFYIITLSAIVIFGFFPDYFRALSFGGLNDQSYDYRSETIQYTLDIIRYSSNGIGVGQFSFSGFTYPHNIILESFVEWGWLFGALFSSFVIGGVALCLFLERNIFLFSLLAVFEFLNSIVSGDMTSPRLLYGLCLYGWLLLVLRVLSRSDPRSSVHLENQA